MDRIRLRGRRVEERRYLGRGLVAVMVVDPRSIKGEAFRRLSYWDQKLLAHGMTLQRATLLTYTMGWRDPKTTLRRYQEAQRRYHAVILDEIARALASPRLGRHRREWLLQLRRTIA